MNDYISRQVALNLLTKWADGYNYIEVETQSAINEFERLPSADVQPVRSGQWIGYLEPGCENYHCTACGTAWYPEDLYLGGNDYPKYCPECGAKMENWKSEMDGK